MQYAIPGFTIVKKLYSVILDPRKKCFVIYMTGGNGQCDMGYFIIDAVYMDSVDFQKCEHNIHSNSLVTIYKSVIGNDVINLII